MTKVSAPAMSRAHTGEGSASISVRSDSISLTSFSWRALSSASSRFEPAGVAQPQHRAAADGAAVGLDGAAGERHQLHREAFAVGAQRIDRVLHGLRLVRLEPGAERQHALRHAMRW